MSIEHRGGTSALARAKAVYRGRIAPTPTGWLHLGHARTFWTAHSRARLRGGALVYRNEDLDQARCKREFLAAALEDLRWLGLSWEEGPDCGGRFGLYDLFKRREAYNESFARLKAIGAVYPCGCSRQDVARALNAPHIGEEEPVYPGLCRPKRVKSSTGDPASEALPGTHCWRFRVPDGERVCFEDGGLGSQSFVAGRDFGDFVVWTRDGIASYQLAVVTDDALMEITEVVRGADLLVSTARQLLLYQALGWPVPAFFHCPLVTDAKGARLAKRSDALSIRELRAGGATPEGIRHLWETSLKVNQPTNRQGG